MDERVAARQESLSAAERRVARYLADHPDEVAFASADTLGQVTDTSDATVIRTVKALGYPGLPALKKELQQTVRDRLTPAGRLGRSLDELGDDPEAVLSRVLAESIELLEDARRTIRPDSFAAAVKLLGEAREIVVLGYGGLGVLGEYLTLRLVRLRMRARSAKTSGFLLADELLGLNEHDVLVVIAHQVVSTEIDVAINHAHEVGARIIVVTDMLAEALAGRASLTLTTPIGNSQLLSVQATTLALFDALVLAIASREQEPALHAMALMNRLRGELRGEGEPPADVKPARRRSGSRRA
ncbi:MurR/RpiR family transcriptional regulator [Amycolatopsis sp. DSM 110486]|uniref:MurR/RpiR family transcriptional regulator n=1 Tax=Amycolatopsis sp. DSM 110486 TaxID=2865832 RepID=UPI001C6A5D42|nr:MurR/RpiR family transcriptional regulator [Amycolatopsis sp. DSM 110486]QYN18987.1 MurR/RpiR family transcriptional regulator [Amycolatopsis sp. DSM 110486]